MASGYHIRVVIKVTSGQAEWLCNVAERQAHGLRRWNVQVQILALPLSNLCDLQKVTLPLWASIHFSICKMEIIHLQGSWVIYMREYKK